MKFSMSSEEAQGRKWYQKDYEKEHAARSRPVIQFVDVRGKKNANVYGNVVFAVALQKEYQIILMDVLENKIFLRGTAALWTWKIYAI